MISRENNLMSYLNIILRFYRIPRLDARLKSWHPRRLADTIRHLKGHNIRVSLSGTERVQPSHDYTPCTSLSEEKTIAAKPRTGLGGVSRGVVPPLTNAWKQGSRKAGKGERINRTRKRWRNNAQWRIPRWISPHSATDLDNDWQFDNEMISQQRPWSIRYPKYENKYSLNVRLNRTRRHAWTRLEVWNLSLEISIPSSSRRTERCKELETPRSATAVTQVERERTRSLLLSLADAFIERQPSRGRVWSFPNMFPCERETRVWPGLGTWARPRRRSTDSSVSSTSPRLA